MILVIVNTNLAYRLLAEKKIRAFRIGKKWKITMASVENYLAENSR
ncbi:MAG: helix-turn-helix domain-containing protein [Lachnospiraceae bacterium]|nr:helix-turn-helix domain-containing protein [Lachnospiraceae bacterium]